MEGSDDWIWNDGPGPDLRGFQRGAQFGHAGGMGMVTKISTRLFPWPGPAVFPTTGNALATAKAIRLRLDQLSPYFPPGVKAVIPYDSSKFVGISIRQVATTLLEAVALVFIVMFIFLQNWRYTLIPTIVVPVALLGTLAVMLVAGFSINVLTMFGMVLVIGIVVDDAIVVVEATEHHIEQGMTPRAAAHQAMAEVSAPVIAIGLVLSCVFIPCVFITGITGRFFRQFALTIAVSTILSTFNSLTLSPALCAILLKQRHEHRDPISWVLNLVLGWFFKGFNKVFGWSIAGYTWAVGKMLRVSLLVLLVYGGLLYLTGWSFNRMPTGFIPNQDQGFLYVAVQLPDSSSLERTEEVMAKVDGIVRMLSEAGLA